MQPQTYNLLILAVAVSGAFTDIPHAQAYDAIRRRATAEINELDEPASKS